MSKKIKNKIKLSYLNKINRLSLENFKGFEKKINLMKLCQILLILKNLRIQKKINAELANFNCSSSLYFFCKFFNF